MDFNTFLNQAWADHGNDTRAVASRLREGLALIENGAQIGQLAHLVTHVYGEHLAAWMEGEQELEELLKHKNLDEEGRQVVVRSKAALLLSADETAQPTNMNPSDQARVLATAASARMAHGHLESAERLLKSARALCAKLPKEDPAQKTLAATANNLACHLEEKKSRTDKETELMLLAARVALVQWGIAGGWLQVQAAHYRMSKSALQAGLATDAHVQALTCLQINEANGGSDYEFFAAYECLACAEHARGNSAAFTKARAEAEKYFSQLGSEDQKWARADMENVRALRA